MASKLNFKFQIANFASNFLKTVNIFENNDKILGKSTIR